MCALFRQRNFAFENIQGFDHEARSLHCGCYRNQRRETILPSGSALDAAINSDAIAADRFDPSYAREEKFWNAFFHFDDLYPKVGNHQRTTSGCATSKVSAGCENNSRNRDDRIHNSLIFASPQQPPNDRHHHDHDHRNSRPSSYPIESHAASEVAS